MNIAEALQKSLQEGVAVRRISWKLDMFIFHTVGNTVSKEVIPKMISLPNHVKEILVKRGNDIPFMTSITACIDGQMIPGFMPSEDDAIIEDWEVFQ